MNPTTAAHGNPMRQLRFFAGAVVALAGAGLWLAEMARLVA